MRDDELVSYLIQRIENIDKKVDKILEFKWQIIGGATVLSAVISIAISLGPKLFK